MPQLRPAGMKPFCILVYIKIFQCCKGYIENSYVQRSSDRDPTLGGEGSVSDLNG